MPPSAANRTQDFREIPPPERKADVLREAMSVLRERLPDSWSLRTRDERPPVGDSVIDITAPDGQGLTLVIEAKRSIAPRDVQPILDQLAALASNRAKNPLIPVLVARYLPETTRQRIVDAGAGYIDATGNVRITADRPALLLSDRGADNDPWRGPGRPRSGLRGEPAARVVRALVDFAPPYSVPDLAERAGSSTGATYRVTEFLEQEELIARQPYGQITEVRWRELLTLWSEDYGLTTNPVSLFIEPRGLDAFVERLRDITEVKYVLSGSLAAEKMAWVAPARQAVVYADDPQQLAAATGLRPTEVGANVVVATPRYDVVFDRAATAEGLRTAAPSQIVVDLLTGPGRNPSEAVGLLDWMEANEPVWRD
jgi:hypothetical protein